MASTTVEIWNLALGACGAAGRISDVNETSPQANICRQWYDSVRLYVNKQAPWGCALAWSRLALKAERDFAEEWTANDPGPRWKYVYSLPTDYLNSYHLESFARFELALHKGIPSLHTNQEKAVLRYVAEQPLPSFWEQGFENAVVSLLAFRIAPQINAKFGSRDRLREEAFEFIDLAIEENANNGENTYDAMPSAYVARGYAGALNEQKFLQTFDLVTGSAF